MKLEKVTVDIENGRYHTGYGDQVVVTVKIKSWDALPFNFKQIVSLDSFETEFDRVIEMARRAIHNEVSRIKADQLPYGEGFTAAMDQAARRNETGEQGVRGA